MYVFVMDSDCQQCNVNEIMLTTTTIFKGNLTIKSPNTIVAGIISWTSIARQLRFA